VKEKELSPRTGEPVELRKNERCTVSKKEAEPGDNDPLQSLRGYLLPGLKGKRELHYEGRVKGGRQFSKVKSEEGGGREGLGSDLPKRGRLAQKKRH